MIALGNLFFKNRNWLFLLFYLALFLPSPPIFSTDRFGDYYYVWPIATGLFITISGQLLRGMTIGLAYIIRGGREGKPYADGLVTRGMFSHCRNPLYVGNILMLLGVGILANSLLFVSIMIPLFLFVYQAMVLAEEQFLRGKFGEAFDAYCHKVNRWVPDLSNISATFASMHFNWKRWILKEYNTQFVWLSGIVLLLLLRYPELTNFNKELRTKLLIIILPALLCLYLLARYLKKSGKLKE